MIEWSVVAVFVTVQIIFFTALSWRIKELERKVKMLQIAVAVLIVKQDE